ncbi:Alpha/Beta hydrolase protein [Polychytrium aggregatum]|uniref:Alpha/Beta hydrolase protein n=1 Tax=Polychytrium aggregatum TaxID=110093 RepID=UPI0022FE8237|nr:Alpha/Beta hydrolase protein [Polychytrium aggregatum]KAI9208546.1 Alpha/Beta hydrolase protein [Polychytrium aggregatum]
MFASKILAFAKSSLARDASKYNPIKGKTRVGFDRGQPVDIYHEIHGYGEHKVLFITGWAGSCDNWKFQTEYFGRHGDFQVCIYENRGSGFSSAPLKRYRMADMAHDAKELIQHLGWKNVHVVGVSMGGMIAQELALMMPDRVRSLCLASTHAGRAFPPAKYAPMVMSTLAKIALGLEEMKQNVPKMLYSHNWLYSPAPPETGYDTNLEYIQKFHDGRIDERPPQSIAAAFAQFTGILRHYVSAARLRVLAERFEKYSIPAMVVHGTEDCLVHLKNAYDLASNLRARLVVFEGRGHAMNHEDIDTFNSLLLRHFYTAILGKECEAASRAGWQAESSTHSESGGALVLHDQSPLSSARQLLGMIANDPKLYIEWLSAHREALKASH